MRAWGYNSGGELGDATTTSSSTPVQVRDLTDVTALAAGDFCGYALRRDGTVHAWGANSGGALGDGTTTDRTSPVQVAGLHDISALAGGGAAGYALRRDGTAWAWGGNHHGQLGDASTLDRSTPVRILTPTPLAALAAGSDAAYALGGPDHRPHQPPSADLRVIPTLAAAPSVAIAQAGGSAPGSSPLASYTIDFGDGTHPSPGTNPTVTHLYSRPGRYPVTLTLTDRTGATATRTATVALAGPPARGPAISWRRSPPPLGCSHCFAVTVTSTGTAPLIISAVIPAPGSGAVPRSTCPASLPVGASCVISWSDVPGSTDGDLTNMNVALHHNAPGRLTLV
ncbi:PKD domain-containing protein [Frankia sp. AgKG'84/4]|uniref:PKD domain-containing protein n=1 Tax=Frankia sp. AgKG'84/4 TaxID=573490 RepID=UPI0035B044DE